jgi:hypothetical protein
MRSWASAARPTERITPRPRPAAPAHRRFRRADGPGRRYSRGLCRRPGAAGRRTTHSNSGPSEARCQAQAGRSQRSQSRESSSYLHYMHAVVPRRRQKRPAPLADVGPILAVEAEVRDGEVMRPALPRQRGRSACVVGVPCARRVRPRAVTAPTGRSGRRGRSFRRPARAGAASSRRPRPCLRRSRVARGRLGSERPDRRAAKRGSSRALPA